MKKLTPVLLVETIEPCLSFWVDRLGFAKTVEVPQGDALGFVILQRGGVEVMLQSRASVMDDTPALAQGTFEVSGVGLFIEVDELDPILDAIRGCEVVVPERVTFYGMREVGVRAPGGCCVVFAQKTG